MDIILGWRKSSAEHVRDGVLDTRNVVGDVRFVFRRRNVERHFSRDNARPVAAGFVIGAEDESARGVAIYP